MQADHHGGQMLRSYGSGQQVPHLSFIVSSPTT
jgi:hypothetical protein